MNNQTETLTFTSNWGRFKYAITAAIPKGLPVEVQGTLKEGLANCGFRGAATSCEKALVRAKAMKSSDSRKVVVYNADNVAILNTAAQAKLNELATEEKLLPMTFKVTGEHVFEEAASPMVRATALVDAVLGTKDEAQMRAYLTIFDKAAAKADRAGLIEIAHKAGAGIQPARK